VTVITIFALRPLKAGIANENRATSPALVLWHPR
jgi:hypothetical protein